MKKKIILGMLAALLVLLAVTALAAPGDVIGNMMVVNCSNYVSMRLSPDTGADRVAKVEKGDVVRNCYVYDEKFTYCEFGGKSGYILSEYLLPSDGIKTFGMMKVVKCKEYITLREKPSTSAAEVARVPLNAIVYEAAYESSSFTYVEYDGKSGYVLTKYLSDVPDSENEYKVVKLGKQQVVNCDEWVSLRTAPDKKAARAQKVPLGAKLSNCHRISNEFAYVEYNGKSGYILNQYLCKPAAVLVDMYVGDMTVVNCEEWVSLRQKPDTGSTRLKKIPAGTVLQNCTIYSEGFVKTSYDGKTGYVAIDYLAPSGIAYRGTTMQVVNCEEWVSLRKGPSGSVESYMNVPLNACVNMLSQYDQNYAYVEYEGKYGFIASEYLAPYTPGYAGSTGIERMRAEIAESGAAAGCYLIASDINQASYLLETPAYFDMLLLRHGEELQPVFYEAAQNAVCEISGGQQLYLIIPADSNAVAGVFEKVYVEQGDSYAFNDVFMQEIAWGAPFLVRCNATEIYADVEIRIMNSDGSVVVWKPNVSFENGRVDIIAEGGYVYDFTPYNWVA